MAVKRPKKIEQLPSVCKPTQKPQFLALMTDFCVLNEYKIKR